MKKDSADVKKAQKILDYWYTMEFLAQDKYDAMWDIRSRMKKAKADYRSRKLKDKTLWDYFELQKPGNIYGEVSSEASGCGMKKWGNITIYIGKIKRESCIECIAEALPTRAAGERCERSFDEIAWASLQLAPDGTYVEHSLSLSTVIWAMAQIRNNSGKLSDRIDEKQYRQAVEELENRFFGKEDQHGRQDSCTSGYVEMEEQGWQEEQGRQEDQQMQQFSPDAVTEDTLCRLFPDQKIRGQGKGRGMVALKDAREEEFTLGTFEYIIHGKCEKLGSKMAETGKKEYNERWWLAFEHRLKNCKGRRNQCCHSGLFTWADQSALLREMFRKEQEGREKEGKGESRESRAQMSGLMFAAEAGKML